MERFVYQALAIGLATVFLAAMWAGTAWYRRVVERRGERAGRDEAGSPERDDAADPWLSGIGLTLLLGFLLLAVAGLSGG